LRRIWPVIILFQMLGAAGLAGGQTAPNAAADPATGATPPAPASRFSRWFELQAGNLALDYKNAEPTGAPWHYQLQYRFLARGLLKIDEKGRYDVGFRVSTGNTFTFSWNNTAAGLGDFEGDVYLKELYLSASPWKHIEIQFGGIGINRGESTEITSYSNNGYLMGERLSIRCPEKLFFDEISATGAYLGDFEKPGVFQRFHRLDSMNYHQFLVAKKLGKQLSVSADYTFQDGVETLRQALKVNIKRNRFLDSLVFENYERVDFQPAWGCALSAQKSPTSRLTLTGGYADIDEDYGGLNADRMGKGRRLYIVATYNFWREFSAGVYATRAFSNDFALRNQARYDLILTYDVPKALKRAHIL
jgi:hypothetical protein